MRKLLLFFFLVGCSKHNKCIGTFTKLDGSNSPQEVILELADNSAERSLGLMYRKSLDVDSGMLFIFPEESEKSFWMKNTYISLDIIFINQKNEVVSIKEGATPYSEESIPSHLPARYVVELAAGSAKNYGIKTGSQFSFKCGLKD